MKRWLTIVLLLYVPALFGATIPVGKDQVVTSLRKALELLSESLIKDHPEWRQERQ